MDDFKINPATLAFDIDGVVADTMSLFVEIAREEFHYTSIRYEDITSYNLLECMDMDIRTLETIIDRVVSLEVIHRLRPIRGARPVLHRLARDGDPILFVTARSEAEPITQWIVQTFGFRPDQVAIEAAGQFDAKTDILLQKGIEYFVEDRLETCFPLNQAGITPVLFRQPWNRQPHPFIEVASWSDLAALIEFHSS